VAEIVVEPVGEDEFRVRVSEGNTRTTHRVTARRDQQLRYGGEASPERLIEESFRFLLEREPKESILQVFELPVIEQYFPEYGEQIRRRLAG
jgi:tRNA nucleotidyltransferase/poly(A) polymerase